MSKTEELRQVVESLIDVMHLQAKEIEKLIAHVERSSGHLGYTHQFSIVSSQLSELHVRAQKLKTKNKEKALEV